MIAEPVYSFQGHHLMSREDLKDVIDIFVFQHIVYHIFLFVTTAIPLNDIFVQFLIKKEHIEPLRLISASRFCKLIYMMHIKIKYQISTNHQPNCCLIMD